MRKSCNRVFKRCAALFVVFSLLFSLTACAGGKGSVPVASVRTVTGDIVERKTEVTNRSLHLIDPESLGTPMASSGLMQIFLDDNSFGIALYEKTKEKFWYSMPTSANANYDYSAATVTMDVLYGNTMYKLNSQDDCMAYRNVACDTLGDSSVSGFTVTYILTSDAETAKKVNTEQIFDGTISASLFNKTDIAFMVKITYALRDGNLYVSAEHKNLSENPDAIVCDLFLLPFFGATDSGEKGDYMLIPDGCGAMIHTDVRDANFEPISLRVYGTDAATNPESTESGALFPAFGAKQGENAFAVIIEKGDAISTIHADRASGVHGYNIASASFCITEREMIEKNGKKTTYVNKKSYDGEICLCVRLLGGANAGLNGLAAACREQFMRTDYLSTDTVQNEEYLPFTLNIIGAYNDAWKLLPFLRTDRVLTTFDQAQDLLARMKAKGINNVNIRYKDALKGSTNAGSPGKVSLLRRLGGRKGLRALHDYAVAQGHNLYLDVPLVSFASSKKVRSENAMSIQSDNAVWSVASDLSGVLGQNTFIRKLLRIREIERVEIDLLTQAKNLSLDGFSISDVGTTLYSDYSGAFTSRQEAMGIVRENLPALSTDRLLMIQSGNFYSIKYADMISDLPMAPTHGERVGLYTAVPFAQMILHGTLDYAGTAVNLGDNLRSSQLRSVEFGALPTYEWCFSESGGDRLSFQNQLNDAVEFYQSANVVLADLRSTRIVDNGETEIPGVRFTQFDNGAMLYVNYNNHEVTVGNIHLDAESFERIG